MVPKFEDYFYVCESSKSRLKWKINIGSGRGNKLIKYKVGDDAGYISQNYWKVQLHSKSYLVHRVLYYLYHGELPEFIDHEDQNSLNNSKDNLRAATKAINGRNRGIHPNNVSGVTGVYRVIRNNGEYIVWTAEWKPPAEKKQTKSFSTGKYGEQEAFRLACEYRAKMIEDLNSQGAGYTERHGK